MHIAKEGKCVMSLVLAKSSTTKQSIEKLNSCDFIMSQADRYNLSAIFSLSFLSIVIDKLSNLSI